MADLESLWKSLPPALGKIIQESCCSLERLEEIRLRLGQPILLKEKGGWIPCMAKNDKKRHVFSNCDMKACVSLLSAYSLYAFAEEIRQGFLTIEGGHRIGFCGKAVMEDGKIKTLHPISSLNIRIAREVKGCADHIFPYLFDNGRFCHTLILSPPGCGKTTLLRELIRNLSRAEGGYAVGVVDERGEIAGMCGGMAQMDLGECTDVISGCPKAEGMLLLLRSMSPQIIPPDHRCGRAGTGKRFSGSFRSDSRWCEASLHCSWQLFGRTGKTSFSGEIVGSSGGGTICDLIGIPRCRYCGSNFGWHGKGHVRKRRGVMVQSIGICMILAVTTLTGAYFCLREKYRLQDLRELERAMVMMESQIRFLSVPLSEVLENISYQTKGQVGMLMQETAKAMAERTGETAEQIWETVWMRYISHTYLSVDDYQSILRFGKTLGYLDQEQQKNSTELFLTELRQKCRQIEHRLEKNGRLYYSMGFLGGLMLVIVLL